MAAEAYPIGCTSDFERGTITLSAAAEPGDLLQYHDGRACYVEAVDDLASGDKATVVLGGEIEVPLAANVAAVRGMPCYWDESANTAVAVPGLNVGDFYLGIFTEDKPGGTGARATVELNKRPAALWSLRDGAQGQGVGDVLQETNGLGVRFLSGGAIRLAFDAVSEAATASLLSGAEVPVADNWLFYAIVNIVANGDAAAFDFVVGVANDDHATDPDAIGESCFVSVNGASVNLNAECDDGVSGEVAATDTTKDFTAGTPFAVWIDGRTITDIQIYIDGVNVLPSSTFTLGGATGPIGALALAEKTADDTAAEVVILDMGLLRIDDAAA